MKKMLGSLLVLSLLTLSLDALACPFHSKNETADAPETAVPAVNVKS